MRSPHTAKKSRPCSPQLEKARTQQRRPDAAKKKKERVWSEKEEESPPETRETQVTVGTPSTAPEELHHSFSWGKGNRLH